ncbi:hypothetical protein [Thalassobacillus sp. CUG 92003]|uniref:hypothetical protein n=1 Tax=Thalassobacillus sp. CUG 92003 TaxID=2736641 RepID=UPI0015E64215|nr:hypothetical protein [Thalassobacillus sp. CUG 92003]
MYTLTQAKSVELPEAAKVIYYPYLVSEWSVAYRPLPFMKERKEKIKVVTNVFRKETSLFEWPSSKMKTLTTIGEGITLPKKHGEAECLATAKDFIRNIYLHKRKVWSNPVISSLNTYSLYVGYATFLSSHKGKPTYKLLELATGHEADVAQHKDIHQYLKAREVLA